MEKKNATHKDGDTKKLVVIRGKGTPYETRIETDVTLIYNAAWNRWMTIPED